MKAESEAIYAFFTQQTAFTVVMGNNLFPLVANEDVKPPFSLFRIQTTEGETKDADKAIVSLLLYYAPDQYTECVSFCDVVEQLVKQKYDWLGSQVDYIEDDQSFVANINFEIT